MPAFLATLEDSSCSDLRQNTSFLFVFMEVRPRWALGSAERRVGASQVMTPPPTPTHTHQPRPVPPVSCCPEPAALQSAVVLSEPVEDSSRTEPNRTEQNRTNGFKAPAQGSLRYSSSGRHLPPPALLPLSSRPSPALLPPSARMLQSACLAGPVVRWPAPDIQYHWILSSDI